MNPLRLLLALYARLERPLLRFNYWLVRSPLVRWPVTRQLLWLGVFLPISYAGAAGQPMTAGEAVELLQAAGEEGVIAVGPCGCRTVHRLRDLRRVCAFGAREADGSLNAEHCYGCGLCADACPAEAVTMVPRER
jgi:hypothetical protein